MLRAKAALVSGLAALTVPLTVAVPAVPAVAADVCDGVNVDSVAKLLDINGQSNKTFCIAPSTSQSTGKYELGSRVLKPGNNVTLIGAPVTMKPDGYGHDYAVSASSKIHGTGLAIIDLGEKNTVTIKNFDLSGSVGDCDTKADGTIVTGGVNLNISYSRLYDGFNQAIGHFKGGTFDHLEVDHNGAPCLRGQNAGGIKTGNGLGYRITNSFVHDNRGPGIWCDVNCDNFNVLNNDSVRNSGQGIRYEHGATVGSCSSCTASIKYNVAKNNGLNDDDRANAGIGINSSENAEVAFNTLGGNFNHNGVYLQDGRHPLKNVWIHDNTMGGDAIKSCSKSGVTCSNNRL